MKWTELAPWIAIAITLILSIITPLLTQIANNRFILKQNEQAHKNKIESERALIYYSFAEEVGSCIAYADIEKVHSAGAAIQKMYLVMPEEHWNALDSLYSYLRKSKWDAAEEELKDLCKIASKIMNNMI